jgi:adenylate kinase family enzyme
MDSERNENRIAEKAPRVVEILGPAGAGKSTLLRVLSQRDSRLRPDIGLSRAQKIPFFVSNTYAFLPTYLRHYRHSRWFNWRESRSMAYLEAGLYAMGQQASRNGAVTLLDLGPMYRLAFLREFGPEITTSERYKRWWTGLLDRWTATLDMVIWLDAPDAVLLERVCARDRWHTIKDQPEEEAFTVLARYRRAFEQVIAESGTDHQVRLLHFDTDRVSVEQIADSVLAEFGGV